jgi:hypothetical protein
MATEHFTKDHLPGDDFAHRAPPVSAFTKRLDPVLYSPEEEAHIHAIAQDASHLFPMDKVFASRFFSCSEDQTLLVTEISRQILEQNTHYQNHLCWLLDVLGP